MLLFKSCLFVYNYVISDHLQHHPSHIVSYFINQKERYEKTPVNLRIRGVTSPHEMHCVFSMGIQAGRLREVAGTLG